MPFTGTLYPVPFLTLGALVLSFSVYTLVNTMWTSRSVTIPLAALISTSSAAVDLKWYPPASTQINDLSSAINGTGVYGYIFDTSSTPEHKYGTYNWCNMPHVRKAEYVTPSNEYKLRYVEVIHRHHKRTPTPPTPSPSNPTPGTAQTPTSSTTPTLRPTPQPRSTGKATPPLSTPSPPPSQGSRVPVSSRRSPVVG